MPGRGTSQRPPAELPVERRPGVPAARHPACVTMPSTATRSSASWSAEPRRAPRLAPCTARAHGPAPHVEAALRIRVVACATRSFGAWRDDAQHRVRCTGGRWTSAARLSTVARTRVAQVEAAERADGERREVLEDEQDHLVAHLLEAARGHRRAALVRRASPASARCRRRIAAQPAEALPRRERRHAHVPLHRAEQPRRLGVHRAGAGSRRHCRGRRLTAAARGRALPSLARGEVDARAK